MIITSIWMLLLTCLIFFKGLSSSWVCNERPFVRKGWYFCIRSGHAGDCRWATKHRQLPRGKQDLSPWMGMLVYDLPIQENFNSLCIVFCLLKLYTIKLQFKAWGLYEKDQALGIVDPSLKEFGKDEAFRAICVALVCTQGSPHQRPPMSKVVAMLTGDVDVAKVVTKPSYITEWQLRGGGNSSNTTSS